MINKLACFCILLVISQSNFAAVKHTLFGNYYNDDTRKGSSCAISSDENNKWRLIHLLDNTMKSVHFMSSVCTENHCVSIAYYYNQRNVNISIPIILSSQDGGVNWSQIKYINGIHTKLEYLQGLFQHIVCYDLRCFASGFVEDVAVDDKSYSLIISEDGGSTWSIPPNQNDADPIASLPRLDFYCNTNQCISRSNYHGTFLVSQNMGLDRRSVKFNLPDSKEIRINDLNVSEENFVAIGYDSTQSGKLNPLIIISTDGGLTWQVKVNEVNIDAHHITMFNRLSCNKNICLASGSDREHAILMLSRDAGITWQAYSTSDKEPDGAISMTIKKSICKERACAIIGVFHLSSGGSRPLIATLNLDENEYHLTSGALNAEIEVNDINCSHFKCYVAGNYYNYRKDSNAPVLFESDDLMMSWKDISDKDILQDGDFFQINSMATTN